MNFQTSRQTTYPADPKRIMAGKINIKPYKNSQPSPDSSPLCLSELAIQFPCLLDSALCLSQQLVSICCLPSALGLGRSSVSCELGVGLDLGEEGLLYWQHTHRKGGFMEQPTASSMDILIV